MSYKEDLKDPRWQRKRLEILQRDEFSCRICNNKELTLHVHHKAYLSSLSPWLYNDNYLITLCDTCHEKHHFKNIKQDSSLQISGKLKTIRNINKVALGWIGISTDKNILLDKLIICVAFLNWTANSVKTKEELEKKINSRSEFQNILDDLENHLKP